MRKLRQSERSNLSDKRMVETAIAIMLNRGISGLRLTDVGLQAGYSRGLAAMRFGTMRGLLRRVAEHLGQQWLTLLNKTVGDKSGLAAIYGAIDAQELYFAPPVSHVRVQYLILFHSIDPGTAERLNAPRLMVAQRRDVAHWLREAIKSGEAREYIDPESEAESIVGAMAGIVFQSLIDPGLSVHKLSTKLKSEIAARISTLPAAPIGPQHDVRTVRTGHG
jgi:AcrR family transcriptional regulator